MACMFLRPSALDGFSGKQSHTQAFSNPLVGLTLPIAFTRFLTHL